MKLTHKEFQIRQTTDNKEDYIVEETFYFFGISFNYCFHSDGEQPFANYFAAKEKIKKLEKKEKIDCMNREGDFIFGVVAIILILIFSFGRNFLN